MRFQYIETKTNGFYSIEDVAFIWQDGAMQKLIDQITGRDFAYLYYAMDINNDDAIVGTGRLGKKLGSEQHMFLLMMLDREDDSDSILGPDALLQL